MASYNSEVKSLTDMLSNEGFKFDVERIGFVTGNTYEIKYFYSDDYVAIAGMSKLTKSVGFSDVGEKRRTRLKITLKKGKFPSLKISPRSFFTKFLSTKNMKIEGSASNDENTFRLISEIEPFVLKEGWTVEMKGEHLSFTSDLLPTSIAKLVLVFRRIYTIVTSE